MATTKQIEGRVSYREFNALYYLMRESPDEALRMVHSMIDRRSGYGSATNAYAAKESVEYIIKKNKDNGRK